MTENNLPILAQNKKLVEIMQRLCTLQEIAEDKLQMSPVIKDIFMDAGVIEAIGGGRYKVNITEEQLKEAIEIAKDMEVKEEIERQESKKLEQKEFLDWVEVTPKDIAEFEQILQDNDALEYFYPYVCPKVVEMDTQKKAILLALASHWDEAGDRFRVSVLLYGETGTGKTPLLRWLKEIGGGYVGLNATKSGLTVNLKNASPGFFAQYHHSVCAVDELDKLTTENRNGILQALEEGIITFEAADVKGDYPAEAIIVGGANEISRFSPEQRERWDFQFNIEQYSIDKAQQIADSVSRWMGKSKRKETEKLVKFLKWIRSRKANISDEVREEGANLIKEYIRRSGNTRIRRVEAIWRIARAYARLQSHDVTGEDVAKTIVLLEECDELTER